MGKYAIIGGDLRIVYLANMLAEDKHKVYVYGQEYTEELKNYDNMEYGYSLEETVKKSEIIISSIPFSKNGIEIYAPFSKEKINIKDFSKYLNNKIFFAGSIPESFYNSLNNTCKVIDLMKQEDLTILNTIATAEGAISDIINNTKINIHGSKILVLGFGRVAKVLAKKLKALDAIVTCAARKDNDFAWMETLGYNIANINNLGENLKEYNIIVNTVPQLMLDENKLKKVNKECLLLDLASKPGGIEEEACKKLGLKFIWSLAIPGKVSPISSAQYIIKTVYNALKQMS